MKSCIAAMGRVMFWNRSNPAMAVPKYRIPAQINLVLRLDVSHPKSYRSIKAVFKPRIVASNATPQPVTPPPITNTSKCCSVLVIDDAWCNRWICSSREGIFNRGSGGMNVAFLDIPVAAAAAVVVVVDIFRMRLPLLLL